MPTAKALLDGLVDYGLVPDDNARHVEGPYLAADVLPPVNGRPALIGRVRVTITELASKG